MTNSQVRTIFSRTVWQAAALVVTGVALVAQQVAPPNTAPAQPLAPDQLDTLVAPVALYPDPLLGQIMAASTYPLEITEASQWLQQNRGLQGQQLMDAARQQNWDPSVQALVAFPDVVGRLSSDIRWTTDLGNAFLAQQADVMAAVQRMRARAQANGKLTSNGQQTVTTQMDNGQQAIDIEPANPETVYVPYYNPAYVWGPPAYGYYPAWDDWGYGFGYGPGIYIGGFFGGLGWGGWGWGCNWFGGFIFNRPLFFSHYGFNGYYGGRAWGTNALWAHNASHRLGVAYSNRALTSRYGAASTASRAFSGGHFAAPASRGSTASAGGWNRFNGSTANGSRSGSAYSGSGNAYRGSATSSYRGNESYGRSYGSSAPRSYNNIAPRSNSYGGSRSSGYSAPRSYSSGRTYGGGSSSAPHSSGGSGHVSSGGGSHASGGGGHAGGGGHSGGGGGHSGGGHR